MQASKRDYVRERKTHAHNTKTNSLVYSGGAFGALKPVTKTIGIEKQTKTVNTKLINLHFWRK